MSTDLVPESSTKYACNICDYSTSRKSQYDRHMTTDKHQNLQKSTKINHLVPESSASFLCNCGKKYKDRTGLWRHRNKTNCQVLKEITDSQSDDDEDTYKMETSLTDISDKELIIMLIKQNADLVKETNDFKTMMMKVLENGTHNTTHTNSHNKSFNLQFFLNETCKDAMNITEFVDSLKLQVSDLECVGELGYIEGISSIIVRNLKELDVTQRPVHCTDKKRETIYIKDENKWEKDEENKKMHKLVRKVADKNARLLPKFKEKYPDYNKSSSRVSDRFNKIIIESMGGPGDNDYEKEEKIIKKVSKEITVNKE